MIPADLLQRAVDHSPASVMITDASGVIQYVNPKFELVSGYTAAEAIGRKPSMLKSGRQSDEFYRGLWRTITSGQEWHGEFTNRTKTGEFYLERASISPVRSATGEISHFIAIKEDVTAERKAEIAARVQQDRFELALRGAHDGVWDWDLATDDVFYSSRWKTMLGYDEEEVEPRLSAFQRLVHADDGPSAFAAVKSYLSGASDRYDVQLRMRHKAGHFVHVIARGFASRDADGRPTRFVGTHLDITDRVRTEERLRAQASAMHVLATATTLMETLPRLLAAIGEGGAWSVGCVWVVDPSADVLRCLTLWTAADIVDGEWTAAARRVEIPRGQGAAGEAWAAGHTIWAADEAASCAGSVAGAAGFRASFAVPFVIRGKTVAVMQFCAPDVRPRDDRWLQMLETLHQLAVHIIERRQAEHALDAVPHGRTA